VRLRAKEKAKGEFSFVLVEPLTFLDCTVFFFFFFFEIDCTVFCFLLRSQEKYMPHFMQSGGREVYPIDLFVIFEPRIHKK